jgi:hypothetical protein
MAVSAVAQPPGRRRRGAARARGGRGPAARRPPRRAPLTCGRDLQLVGKLPRALRGARRQLPQHAEGAGHALHRGVGDPVRHRGACCFWIELDRSHARSEGAGGAVSPSTAPRGELAPDLELRPMGRGATGNECGCRDRRPGHDALLPGATAGRAAGRRAARWPPTRLARVAGARQARRSGASRRRVACVRPLIAGPRACVRGRPRARIGTLRAARRPRSGAQRAQRPAAAGGSCPRARPAPPDRAHEQRPPFHARFPLPHATTLQTRGSLNRAMPPAGRPRARAAW